MAKALRVGRPAAPISPTVQNRLRQFREARGMTQLDIATYLGVEQGCISDAERRNDKAIGSDAWDRLADLFDVDPRILKGRKNL